MISSLCHSQENDQEKLVQKITNQSDSIIKAHPVNGIDEFKLDFAKALTIPTNRILEINQKQLRIITSFKVNEFGEISDIKIINDKFGLTNDINTTFSKLPNWVPAKKNGINISSSNSLTMLLNLGLPDYELDENRIPKIALQKADFDAFQYEFNSHMIYPRDFWDRYYYKKGSYDNGNNTTSNVFKYEVKFIINENGEFEDIKTYVNGSYDSYLNAAVKRSLAKCTPWEPATVNGEKVKSSFTYPIQLNIKK